MTQPRPTAQELIEAVREFLADDVLPTLDGRLRFHARVAVNVLQTVERELRDGPAADQAELEGLRALLDGAEAPAWGDPLQPGTEVEVLSRELAARIRSGALDVDDHDLIEHLRRTARSDVATANPRWLPDPARPDGD